MKREVITYNGVDYVRYPESPHRHLRVYYRALDGRHTLHRAVWETKHGLVPDGHHIHHKDLDPLNNSISNLECLEPSEHAKAHIDDERLQELRDHMRETVQPAAAAWHGTDIGREVHREIGRASWARREYVGTITCLHCSTEVPTYFDNDARGDKRFCSRKCAWHQANEEGRYEEEIVCPACGETFMRSKYRTSPKTCSRKCGWVIRRRDAS